MQRGRLVVARGAVRSHDRSRPCWREPARLYQWNDYAGDVQPSGMHACLADVEGEMIPIRLGGRPISTNHVSAIRSLVILRKEVIQPQVLLRLPCYDLVPVIEFTFGAFFPCGFDQRLRVPPTSVA